MIKTRLLHTGLLLLMVAISTAYGQDDPTRTRRTPAEQAAYENSLPLNPPRIHPESQLDPRMEPSQTLVSPTNWKPANSEETDLRKPAGDSGTAESKNRDQQVTNANLEQPEGILSKVKVMNHRGVQGVKTQAEPTKTAPGTNYRGLTGSKVQPDGVKPKQ